MRTAHHFDTLHTTDILVGIAHPTGCRKVSSKWLSNDKVKGKGNKKSGNKYLAWAYSKAAEHARRSYTQARAYYNRKMQKTNFMAAHNALAHKLARAAYYVMRDEVIFLPDKLFL